MKSLQAQFSFCQPQMRFTKTACGAVTSAVLIRIWRVVVQTLQKNKPYTSRNSKSIPLSLHGSQRDLGFCLYVDFLCLPTAATAYTMYWETGHMKITREGTYQLHAVLLPFFPLEGARHLQYTISHATS